MLLRGAEARHDAVEPRVRRLVVEHLGIGEDELACEVSLADDLAADSLDLLELALGLEAEFDIAIPQTLLDGVRTYDELVEATARLVRRRRRVQAPWSAAPAFVRSCVVSLGDGARRLERAGLLTPYTAEQIAADALRAGRGACLEVTVQAHMSSTDIAALRACFAWLAGCGVDVRVARSRTWEWEDPSAGGLEPGET